MNVRENYNKHKELYLVFALLLAGFFITGTILFLKWFKKRQEGRMKNKGTQKSTGDFLTSQEGRENVVYLDDAGNLTVGIGHKVTKNDSLKLGDTISDAEVDDYFRRDTMQAATALSDIISRLNQNQYDAAISLVFNIGKDAFNNSTLKKYIKNSDTQQNISNAWLAWDHEHVNGILTESDSLKKRRQREINLFFQ
jgi:lysozyme